MIVAPPLVIVVVSVTSIVRVQPSSVASESDEPSMAVIVMSWKPMPGPPRIPNPPGPPR